MSMYEMIHGRTEYGPALLWLLNERQQISEGRYRDAWVEADGDACIIRLHTRNGGGNREAYESEIESMQAHPWYLRDEDDSFDCTYADFYFKVDLEWIATNLGDDGPATVESLVTLAQPPVDVAAKWQAAIDAIGKG